MITKPLLASAIEDINSLKLPVLAEPKLDGIRCLTIANQLVSRNFKLIPNEYIQKQLAGLPDGLDGELIVGKTFQECTHGIMSEDGEPEFTYFIFDYVKDSLDKPYQQRVLDYLNLDWSKYPNVVPLTPTWIHTQTQLREFEEKVLDEGYEGVMVRDPNGRYKCGRSSVKEGIILKVKRFMDSEAEVIGFQEQLHNGNVATKDAFGRSERSSHKDNMVPTGKLGALIVKDVKTNIQFNIGTGFDMKTREEIWQNQKKYIGQLVKYKSFLIGVKDAPRFPVFLGFRDKRDM